MTALARCPHPEEYSALIDRELKPERIPELQEHVGHCRVCRELFFRLSAADRMLALSLSGVDVLAECLAVAPDRETPVPDELMEKLDALGRSERTKLAREAERAATGRRRKRRVLVFLVLLALAGAFAGSLSPGPVKEAGSARREGAAWIGPAEMVLAGGIKVRLSDGSRARFWCAFRWERPSGALEAGSLSVTAGRLRLRSGAETVQVSAGQTAHAEPDGSVRVEGAPTGEAGGIQAPAPAPTSTGGG